MVARKIEFLLTWHTPVKRERLGEEVANHELVERPTL